jgi:hypothetical protein
MVPEGRQRQALLSSQLPAKRSQTTIDMRHDLLGIRMGSDPGARSMTLSFSARA